MAGFIGDGRQWKKFEKRASKLFTRYRVDLFHTIDVRRSDADFKGWTVDRKLEFLDEFHYVVNDTLLAGVVSVIRDDDYRYYSGLNWPRKTRRDSKYGVLFRGCFAHVIDVVGQTEVRQEPRLTVVLEDGHKNAEDAARIYKWAQDRMGVQRALSGLTFANKRDCLPLAAADLLAYSAWGQEVGQKPIGTLNRPSKADVSYRNNLHRVGLIRDSLDSLHQQAIGFAGGSVQAARIPLRFPRN